MINCRSLTASVRFIARLLCVTVLVALSSCAKNAVRVSLDLRDNVSYFPGQFIVTKMSQQALQAVLSAERREVWLYIKAHSIVPPWCETQVGEFGCQGGEVPVGWDAEIPAKLMLPLESMPELDAELLVLQFSAGVPLHSSDAVREDQSNIDQFLDVTIKASFGDLHRDGKYLEMTVTY